MAEDGTTPPLVQERRGRSGRKERGIAASASPSQFTSADVRRAIARMDLDALDEVDGKTFKAAVFAFMGQDRARRASALEHRRAVRRAADRRRRQRYPALFRHYRALWRARARGATGSHTFAQWKAKLEEYGQRCAYCGAAGVPLVRSYVTPIRDGGSAYISNIVPACRSCSSKRGAC